MYTAINFREFATVVTDVLRLQHLFIFLSRWFQITSYYYWLLGEQKLGNFLRIILATIWSTSVVFNDKMIENCTDFHGVLRCETCFLFIKFSFNRNFFFFYDILYRLFILPVGGINDFRKLLNSHGQTENISFTLPNENNWPCFFLGF